MAGIIAVYGLVVSVLIIGAMSPDAPYSLYAGFIHLAAGLSCGLTGLAAGHAIGIVGDAVSPLRSALPSESIPDYEFRSNSTTDARPSATRDHVLMRRCSALGRTCSPPRSSSRWS